MGYIKVTFYNKYKSCIQNVQNMFVFEICFSTLHLEQICLLCNNNYKSLRFFGNFFVTIYRYRLYCSYGRRHLCIRYTILVQIDKMPIDLNILNISVPVRCMVKRINISNKPHKP